MNQDSFDAEVLVGRRFEFGKNWRSFISVLDDDRIRGAEASLKELLGHESLAGKRFLDIGSGSGLFSLAAARLGAREVRSFDFDPESVACTAELQKTRGPASVPWKVGRGSVLDAAFIQGLGTWDVVYSWGVLHHTGAMWQALEHAGSLVAPGGELAIAIYNDQGPTSKWWRAVKRTYNRGPIARAAVCGTIIPYWVIGGAMKDVAFGVNPLKRYENYRSCRGMSRVHDWLDWLGGLPFEVASPEAIHEYYRKKDFELVKLRTAGGGLGCNEFAFRRR